jgi:hypothetical protein
MPQDARMLGTLRPPVGRLRDVIEVRETTRLPGEAAEFEWYAPGVGPVKGPT